MSLAPQIGKAAAVQVHHFTCTYCKERYTRQLIRSAPAYQSVQHATSFNMQHWAKAPQLLTLEGQATDGDNAMAKQTSHSLSCTHL